MNSRHITQEYLSYVPILESGHTAYLQGVGLIRPIYKNNGDPNYPPSTAEGVYCFGKLFTKCFVVKDVNIISGQIFDVIKNNHEKAQI